MKNIFTLLFAICFVTIGFAQYQGHDQSRQRNDDVSYNERSYDNNNRNNKSRYNFSRNDLERSIAAINFNYDKRIQSVKNSWSINPLRKRRMVNNLEDQRKADIRKVYYKFKDRRNVYGYNAPGRHM